jgi:hypothetical protein
MNAKLTFRPYVAADRDACLDLFDANCPEYFALNERIDYQRFLDIGSDGYELCLIDERIAGAFGLIGNAVSRRRLNWIMRNPQFHGVGAGRAIMERVVARAASEALEAVDIAASHKSAPFFAKFGAVTMAVSENGWGPGMHRVDMQLPLRPNNSPERAHARG